MTNRRSLAQRIAALVPTDQYTRLSNGVANKIVQMGLNRVEDGDTADQYRKAKSDPSGTRVLGSSK